MTLVNVAVLTIFVGLATLQFASITSDLVGERLVVLAGRTAVPFQAAAKIGLPLSNVRNAGLLLERARQTDSSIDAIHVFDTEGRIVQSTAEPAPATIPPEAIMARAAARGAPWYRETAGKFLGSVDVVPREGGSAGGILITYPTDGKAARVRAMANELSLAAIAVLVASAALSACLLRLGLRRQIEQFEAIDAAVAEFERDASRSASGGRSSVRQGEDGDLPSLLEAAETRYRDVARALAPAPNSTS